MMKPTVSFSSDGTLLRKLLSGFLLSALLYGGAHLMAPSLGEAKKKKKKEEVVETAPTVNEEEVKTILEPVATELATLLGKVQSRHLLSPEESAKVVELKYVLFDLIEQYPTSVQLPKPVYQSGVLLTTREEYIDAHELFSFLVSQFPQSPYSKKARVQRARLEQKLGKAYFPAIAVEMSEPSTAPEKATSVSDDSDSTAKK